MGTVVSIDVRPPFVDAPVIDDAVAWLHDVDERFSTYKPRSEISRLARGELLEAECSASVRQVLSMCAGIHRDSNGAFDAVSYTHLRAHETRHDLVCRLLLEKK